MNRKTKAELLDIIGAKLTKRDLLIIIDKYVRKPKILGGNLDFDTFINSCKGDMSFA